MKPKSKNEVKNPSDLGELRKGILSSKKKVKKSVTVSGGTCGRGSGALELVDEFIKEVEKRNLELPIIETGCHGFCEREPIVIIEPDGIFYQKVEPRDVNEILDETVAGGGIIERLLYVDEKNRKIEKEEEIPFYKKQKRLIFGDNRKICPTEIRDYIAIGGYSALAKVLQAMSPEKVIEQEIRVKGERRRRVPYGGKMGILQECTG
jgi:NADH-quinone oxidoreductase subunit F